MRQSCTQQWCKQQQTWRPVTVISLSSCLVPPGKQWGAWGRGEREKNERSIKEKLCAFRRHVKVLTEVWWDNQNMILTGLCKTYEKAWIYEMICVFCDFYTKIIYKFPHLNMNIYSIWGGYRAIHGQSSFIYSFLLDAVLGAIHWQLELLSSSAQGHLLKTPTLELHVYYLMFMYVLFSFIQGVDLLNYVLFIFIMFTQTNAYG